MPDPFVVSSDLEAVVHGSLPVLPVFPTGDPVTTNIGTGAPDDAIIAAFEESVVKVVSYANIYEIDGTTLFAEEVPITSGSVSVDMGRNERRNLDIVIHDENDSIGYGPGYFWYDKIIVPYRGIELSSTERWVVPLGKFYPDSIGRPRFPSTMSATCRDGAKVLIESKFADTTTFSAGYNVLDLVKAIATNGGITDFSFETTTKVTSDDITFKQGDERMQACVDVAAGGGFEVFFNAWGRMVARTYVDPLTAPVSYNFRAGDLTANLVDYSRTTNDSYLKNDVIVHGSSDSNALVIGRATNTDDTTPTSVNNIGRRMKVIESQTVPDNATANEIAAAFLSVSALEQYDLSMTSIVIPWLEAGDAVTAYLPDAAPIDPTRFLLSSFSIPLNLGAMTATAKRVIVIG